LNELNEFNPWLVLTEVETDLDSHGDIDWSAILHAGPEPPFLDGIDRILVETEAETSHHVNEIDESIFSNQSFENHGALEARFPGFFGIFRVNAIDESWDRHATAPAESISAVTSTFAWPHSRTLTIANAMTSTVSDSITISGAARRRADDTVGIANIQDCD
jgi:hypothetical protein